MNKLILKNKKNIEKANNIFIEKYINIFYNPPSYDISLNMYDSYLKEKNENNYIRCFKEDMGLIEDLRKYRIKHDKIEKKFNRNFSFLLIFYLLIILFYFEKIYENLTFNNIYKIFIDLFIIKNQDKLNKYEKIGLKNEYI